MGNREPGDKLLPRITDAVARTVIATKTGLRDVDAQVRVISVQEIIDRIGREVADHWGPHAQKLLDADNGAMSADVRKLLEDSISGTDQLKAVTGLIMGPVSGAIGTLLSNELAPAVYEIVASNPHLDLDPQTAANAAAQRVISADQATQSIANQGYDPNKAEQLIQMALQYPVLTDAFDMYRRGLIAANDLYLIAEHNSIPETYITPLLDLATAILTPADAALAVLRGDLTVDQGRIIARENGYTEDSFNTLLLNTGEPPGAQELMEALRRGFINQDTFIEGIRQSRVRDQWVQTLLDLRYEPLNTADAVNAYVEGYIDEQTVASIANQNGLEPDQYKILTEAAGNPLAYIDMMRLWRYGLATEDDVRSALKRGRLKDDYIDFALALKDAPMSVADAIEAAVQGYLTDDQAKQIALMNGLRADDFEPLRLTAGSPLSRTEMTELWRRGLVTEDEVSDALRQSRLKDSYIPYALELKVQLPALYETRALLADGGLSAEQGTEILLAQGYQPDIVKAIVSNAVGAQTAIHKALTEAMYADLYKEQAVSASELQQALRALGYTQTQGELIQEIYDNQLAITQRNAVISKVRAGYVGHKLDEGAAQSELNQLGIPSDMVEKLIDDWNLIVATQVKLLTPAQVTDAWELGLFNPSDTANNTTQALDYLSDLGYSEDDAITILEIKNKGPLPNGTQNQ